MNPQANKLAPVSAARKAVSVAAALMLVISSTARADSGGVPEALRQVNATLNALIATVNQLATKVDQLVTSIGTPPTRPTFLFTGSLRAREQVAACSVVNYGATTAPLVMSLRKANGAVIDRLNISVGSGEAAYFGILIQAEDIVYCRIDSAQAGQLRGTLSLNDATGHAQAAVETR